MRQHLILVALLAPAVHAETKPKHKPIDVSDAIGNADVYRDEPGKFYVVPRGGDGDDARKWTFYGDGRTMYLQRVVAFSATEGNATISVWSPRTRGMPQASLEKNKDGTATVICRMVNSKFERRPLTQLSDEEAAKLFKKARFEPVLWERRVFFFGRGEGTKYYLVDILLDEYGGQGFRLFVGPKGQMKQVAISDFANDTEGASVMTKTGELAIAKDGNASWKQGKKEMPIAKIDPAMNGYLIYRELGVYGQLGTICEDQ